MPHEYRIEVFVTLVLSKILPEKIVLHELQLIYDITCILFISFLKVKPNDLTFSFKCEKFSLEQNSCWTFPAVQ